MSKSVSVRVTSDYGAALMRMYRDQYGSYSGIRKASQYDVLRGVYVMPPLSKDRRQRLNEYAFQNWKRIVIFSNERAKLYPEYLKWRRANQPTFSDRVRNKLSDWFETIKWMG